MIQHLIKKPVVLSILTVHMTWEDCLYYEHDEYKSYDKNLQSHTVWVI